MHTDALGARLSPRPVLPNDVDGPISVHESSFVAGSNQFFLICTVDTLPLDVNTTSTFLEMSQEEAYPRVEDRPEEE